MENDGLVFPFRKVNWIDLGWGYPWLGSKHYGKHHPIWYTQCPSLHTLGWYKQVGSVQQLCWLFSWNFYIHGTNCRLYGWTLTFNTTQEATLIIWLKRKRKPETWSRVTRWVVLLCCRNKLVWSCQEDRPRSGHILLSWYRLRPIKDQDSYYRMSLRQKRGRPGSSLLWLNILSISPRLSGRRRVVLGLLKAIASSVRGFCRHRPDWLVPDCVFRLAGGWCHICVFVYGVHSGQFLAFWFVDSLKSCLAS